MDAVRDRSPSQNERKPEIMLKVSDFSIDHILNKAGGDNMKQPNQNSVFDCDINSSESRLKYEQSHEVFDKNYCNYTPILDWLNYTRYRPPKLPSKFSFFYSYVREQGLAQFFLLGNEFSESGPEWL